MSALARFLWSLYAWPAFVGNSALRYPLVFLFRRGPTVADSFQVWMHGWARVNLVGGLYRTTVDGVEDRPAPAVLVSNHQHIFDVQLLTALVTPPLRFVAREEVLRVPLIGSVLRKGGHLTVTRGASAAANEEALGRAVAALRGGARLAFFPEGTRSRDGRIGRLRSGAFRVAAEAGAPVQPVVLAGTRHTIPRLPGPIVPCRLAARFLPPRAVTAEQARSASWRDELRDEMAAALDAITPGTGPRI
ncbi:MAG TPA: lysophospholipid acyltransferase family protein [Candidatus Polarisedimenticolaceae bacterium]